MGSDNHIVVEDSMLEPASPVEAVDCGGLHTGGTATCTAKAVCADCGESYGELDSHRDENGDYKCDVCGKAIGTPSDNPQTGDNSNLALMKTIILQSMFIVMKQNILKIYVCQKVVFLKAMTRIR